jgi:uncharacterized protein (TIGR02118 family)
VETKPIKYIVASQCQPENEEKFNKWYNEIHIPMLLKVKGLTKVTRYEIVNESEEFPKYLAVYEFENQKAFEAFKTSPELKAAKEEMSETWKGKGFEVKWRVLYRPIKTWER